MIVRFFLIIGIILSLISCSKKEVIYESSKRVDPIKIYEEALNAYKLVKKFEKLNPSLEPSHAFAEAIKIAPKLNKNTIIVVNSCGDAKKDRDILKQKLGKY